MLLGFVVGRIIQLLLIAYALDKIASVKEICAKGYELHLSTDPSTNTTNVNTACIEIPHKIVGVFAPHFEISSGITNTTEIVDNWEVALFSWHVVYYFFTVFAYTMVIEAILTIAYATWMKLEPVSRLVQFRLMLVHACVNIAAYILSSAFVLFLFHNFRNMNKFYKVFESISFCPCCVHFPIGWTTAAYALLLSVIAHIVAFELISRYFDKKLELCAARSSDQFLPTTKTKKVFEVNPLFIPE